MSESEKKAVLTFKNPETGHKLVEVRIGGDSGAQTVFPGSVHPSGEEVEWAANGEPAKVDSEDLKRNVAVLAAASLLAQHWPAEGSRHQETRQPPCDSCASCLRSRATHQTSS